MATLDISTELARRIKFYAHQQQESVELLLSRWLAQEEILSSPPESVTNQPGQEPIPPHSSQRVLFTSQDVSYLQPLAKPFREPGSPLPDMFAAENPDGTDEEIVPGVPLRRLVEAAPGAILLIDEVGKIVLANERVEMMFGYSQCELVNQPVEMLLPERFRNKHEAFRADFMARPKFLPLGTGRDLVAMRKDGVEFPVEVGLSYVPSQNGFLALAFVADITERKRVEAALQENVERYRVISNLMSDYAAAYHYLSDDNDQAQLEWAIGTFEQITGHSIANATTHFSLSQPVAAEDLPVFQEHHRRLRTGQPDVSEYRIRDGQGNLRWVRSHSYPVWNEEQQKVVRVHVGVCDITEQRKASEAAAHAAAIIRSSDDAIISKTLDGTIVSWNPGAERLVGYAAAEAIGKSISLFMSPEQHQDMAHVLSRIQQGKMMERHETTWKHKEGHLLNVSLTISPIKNNQEQITGVSVIARDMTESLKSALALKESEARLKQAMKVAHLGVWDWDIATDNTVWAGEIFRMYGITPEEFTGKGNDYLNFTLPEDRAKQRSRIEKAFAQGITEKMLANLGNQEIPIPYQPNDFRILRPDGTVCHVQGDAIAIVDDEGNPRRMIGVLQDVTEQKLAEEELRLYRNQLERLVNERTAELEALTHQLRHEIAERQVAQEALLAEKQHTEMVLNHVADGVISTDVQGDILYVNPAWEQLTGYTSAEVRGRNPRFLQSGYTKRSNYKNMWETILAGDVWTGLFINQRKDQTNFDTLETIAPVKNIQGDITHFVSVWRDVTKEQRLAAMKEEFIANAAHDLSNPITVLHTTLYLLKRDPTQLKQRLTLFEDQIAMLQTLVDDLLTVSRLDRRLMPPAFRRVDLNALITRVLEPQAILAAHKGLTLACTNSLTEPLFIYGDSDMLMRVFVNLIANAVNYTPYDGHITIATRQEGVLAVFVIEDTGIGIAANDIPHIFDRFYRSDNARKTGQGTGLGLAIVKKIVELHQGKIEVESVPQQGTTFRVFLPIETHRVS